MKTFELNNNPDAKTVGKDSKGTTLSQQKDVRNNKDDVSEKLLELMSHHANSKYSQPDVAPFMASLLPDSLQSVLKEAFLKAFPRYATTNGSLLWAKSGGYSTSFEQKIEALTSTSPLPDILITRDFNCLYHRNFKNNLLNKNNFETLHFPINEAYADIKITHPCGLFSMLATDALVIVANKTKFDMKRLPSEWYELLHPSFHKSIALCGEPQSFCKTAFYHFVKVYGYDGVKQLIGNTSGQLTPAEMLFTIHSGKPTDTSVYVMPYSYAQRIEDKINYKVIWPNDGALLIPIQLLVKNGTYKQHQEVIKFLTGDIVGEIFEKQGLLASNPNASREYPQHKLNWMGWDFLENSNLAIMKEEINSLLA
jgi:ABC-type Fe3+ transport system substrate-binding protein